MENKKVLILGNLTVELDRSDDPGNGTPAMVRLGHFHATYWDAVELGYLYGRGGYRNLTKRQLEWLQSIEQEIDTFVYK